MKNQHNKPGQESEKIQGELLQTKARKHFISYYESSDWSQATASVNDALDEAQFAGWEVVKIDSHVFERRATDEIIYSFIIHYIID